MSSPGVRPQLNCMSWQGMGTVDINDGLIMIKNCIRWADQSWLIRSFDFRSTWDKVMLWSDQVMTLASDFGVTSG